MKNDDKNRICVFCGSSTGSNPIYAKAAILLGESLPAAGLGLVYGGGNSGLMGILATTMIEKGGHVTGIMPRSMVRAENAFYEISEYIEVENFHERKLLMSNLSEAFIALPGGPGTLEELIEQHAWSTLGIHKKPIILINTNNFWDPLISMLKQVNRNTIRVGSNPNIIVVDEPIHAVKVVLESLNRQ